MQVNRLFEIVYILLNQKYITAKELAEQFEVSIRTIYRDIEVLCQSGIPIYTSKGRGGGIGLISNFVLNKSILTKQEQEEIMSALLSLNATNYPELNQVITKLNHLFGTNSSNWIEVDFSDWSYNKKETFQIVKTAILQKRVLEFNYYGKNSEKTYRSTQPLQLWFKDKTWYLRAFCRTKSEMRLFKLNRMKEPKLTEEIFKQEIQDVIKGQADFMDYIPKGQEVHIKMKVDASQAYRIYDEFEEEQITKEEDGSFTVLFSYQEDEWVYGYILSFGNYAKVIEPIYISEIIKTKMQKALMKYC